jgi:hypothetical protein
VRKLGTGQHPRQWSPVAQTTAQCDGLSSVKRFDSTITRQTLLKPHFAATRAKSPASRCYMSNYEVGRGTLAKANVETVIIAKLPAGVVEH